MADFMMLMLGDRQVPDDSSSEDWASYIDKLIKTGSFRGGSALGNGIAVYDKSNEGSAACTATGFMRFEAEAIDDVVALLDGNPVYEAGGKIEILEIVKS